MESKKILHEIWADKKGLTTVCLADKRGNDCRELLEPKSKLIHTFYAESHFEAMTIYYKYMNFGKYNSEFENDKEPYSHSL